MLAGSYDFTQINFHTTNFLLIKNPWLKYFQSKMQFCLELVFILLQLVIDFGADSKKYIYRTLYAKLTILI